MTKAHEEDPDTTHPMARFADETEMEIKTITIAQMKMAACLESARGRLWESGSYYIAMKQDRSPMLILC